jgi:signal peptidase I
LLYACVNETNSSTIVYHAVWKLTNTNLFFKETARFALITLAIVIPIRLFIAEPFVVSGASMEPTFQNGEYLIVDRLSYNFEEPKRGEVIIFRYPKDPKKYFIKRIIGLPGETVSISGNTINIRNAANPQGFDLDQSYISRQIPSTFSMTLKDDEYFVMGDNRPQSSDSRVWGALPEDYIVGRALLRLFPFTRINTLPGDHSE